MNILNILENKKHIHFIGIGGSGMYPLAQILHAKGYYLTGSDNNETETLDAVRKMGIEVTLGQKAENIKNADLIIHTAAIMDDNPELIAAKKSGVPVLERSDLLGLVSTWYDNAVCISGTHGKTTASSMLTQICVEAGVDLSCVIGGKLPSIGGSGRSGKSDIMVCEACEFVDTFLKLSPDVAVVLNIDEDHLDYFKTLDNIIVSFNKFCNKATKAVIVNGDDENSMKAVEEITDKDIITFGFNDTNDYYVTDIVSEGMQTTFTLMHKEEKMKTMSIFVPGIHNVLNALAAAVSALYIGIDIESIELGLQAYKGTIRRFEKIAVVDDITIVDDYAHHPAEVEVTLKAATNLGYKRVWAVHQPFTYSRTAMLKDDFARVLSIADKVVLSEIMGSREKNTYNIYSKDLAEKIPDSVWFDTFDEIVDHLCEKLEPGDFVITLGCGDVYKVAKKLSKRLENERSV